MYFTDDADSMGTVVINGKYSPFGVKLGFAQFGDPPPSHSQTVARQILADRYTPDTELERRHPRKHNEMTLFSWQLETLQNAPEGRAYYGEDSRTCRSLYDKNRVRARKWFLGTMPIALLATRARGRRKRKHFLAGSHTGERERKRA